MRTTCACVGLPIDGPCRERGSGRAIRRCDAAKFGLLIRRHPPARLTLLQASAAADAHGVIKQLPPEAERSPTTRCSGSRGSRRTSARRATPTAATLLPRATRCMDYFLSPPCYPPRRLRPAVQRVDWGYTRAPGFAVDPASTRCFAASARWRCGDGTADASTAAKMRRRSIHKTIVRRYWGSAAEAVGVEAGPAEGVLAEVGRVWLGRLHRGPLGPRDARGGAATARRFLRRRGARSARQRVCAYVESSLRACFPIDKDAPRLSDRRALPASTRPTSKRSASRGSCEPRGVCARAVPACVGWALQQSPTWLEVFDVRWRLHSWGGCPTWQLSRFLLGLAPFDVGSRHAPEIHAGATLPACSVPARARPSAFRGPA